MGVEKNAAASTHGTFVINSNVTNFVLTADDRGYCRNMSWKLKNVVLIPRINITH